MLKRCLEIRGDIQNGQELGVTDRKSGLLSG